MAVVKKTAAAKAGKADGYRVTAPLVQAYLDSGTPMQFREGDVLPDGISKESLEHLEDLGYINKGEAPAPSDDE